MLRIIGATDKGLVRYVNEDRFAGEVFSPDLAYGVVCDAKADREPAWGLSYALVRFTRSVPAPIPQKLSDDKGTVPNGDPGRLGGRKGEKIPGRFGVSKGIFRKP